MYKAHELDRLLKKYGIGREAIAKAVPGDKVKVGKFPDEKTQAELGKMVEDQGGFVHEILPYLEKLGLSKGGDADSDSKYVEIKGDKATGAKVEQMNGKEIRQPIEFVKVGRSWYLVADKPAAGKDKK